MNEKELREQLAVAIEAYRRRHAELRAALGAARYAAAKGSAVAYAAASNKYPEVVAASHRVTELHQSLVAACAGTVPDYSWQAVSCAASELAGWQLPPGDVDGLRFLEELGSMVSDPLARISIREWYDRGRRCAQRADLIQAVRMLENAKTVFERAVLFDEGSDM